MTNIVYSDVMHTKRKASLRNKPRDAEKTLAKIMDVAEELFARHGYEGTSLRLVALGVDMSQPNFYNYFSSKEKLYESVLARSFEPLFIAVKGGVSDSLREDETPNHGIAYHVIDAFMDHLSKNHNLAGLMYQDAINGGEALTRLSQGMFDGILKQSASGLNKANQHVWSKEQIPFLVIAWFNLLNGYFASASLMKNILPGASDPLSKKNLQIQRQFLKSVWDKLMKP